MGVLRPIFPDYVISCDYEYTKENNMLFMNKSLTCARMKSTQLGNNSLKIDLNLQTYSYQAA